MKKHKGVMTTKISWWQGELCAVFCICVIFYYYLFKRLKGKRNLLKDLWGRAGTRTQVPIRYSHLPPFAAPAPSLESGLPETLQIYSSFWLTGGGDGDAPLTQMGNLFRRLSQE